MIIHSDDKAIEKELVALKDLLLENGAWFHKQLSIVCENGSMSVQMQGPVSLGDLALKMPQELLVPIDGMNISLKGNDFSFEPDKSILSHIQAEIGDHIIELYNLSDKATLHKDECAWIKYKNHPELLKLLSNARTPNKHVQEKYNYLHGEKTAMSDDAFTCWSFSQTRVLGKKEDDGARTQVVMPIIDFLNHDHRGSPFIFNDKTPSNKIMQIQNQQPFMDSSECYVVYGIYDTLDTFLNYGFPDIHAPYIRSIPIDINIEGYSTLKINALTGARNQQDLPKQIGDLQRFMPVPVRKPDGSVEISHLMVPIKSAPHSMRRILQVLIRTLIGKEAPRKAVIDAVYQAEEKILEANIAFYEDALKTLKTMDAPDDLKEGIRFVADIQLKKLYKYTFKPDFFSFAGDDTEESALEAEESVDVEEDAKHA